MQIIRLDSKLENKTKIAAFSTTSHTKFRGPPQVANIKLPLQQKHRA